MASGPRDPRSQQWSAPGDGDRAAVTPADPSPASAQAPPALHHAPPAPAGEETWQSPWAMPPFAAPVPPQDDAPPPAPPRRRPYGGPPGERAMPPLAAPVPPQDDDPPPAPPRRRPYGGPPGERPQPEEGNAGPADGPAPPRRIVTRPDKLVASGPSPRPRSRPPYGTEPIPRIRVEPQIPAEPEYVPQPGGPEGPDDGPDRRIGRPPGGRPARPREGGRRRRPRSGGLLRRGRGRRSVLTPLLMAAVLLAAAGLGVVLVNWAGSPFAPGLRLSAVSGGLSDQAFAAAPSAAGHGSSQVLTSVTSAGSTVVAVGSDTTGSVTRPLFLISADGGKRWELAQVRQPAGYEPVPGAAGRVAGGNGRWLAAETFTPVTTAEAPLGMWTSTDGRAWTAVDPARLSAFHSGDQIWDIARTASGFVAVGVATLSDGGAGAVAWTSPDGQNWTRVDTAEIGKPDKVRGIRTVVARGDAVVALADPGSGDAQSVILRSPDGGRTWLRTAAALPHVKPEPRALAATKDGFVLVPTRQRSAAGDVVVYCSPQGAEWSRCGAISKLGAHGIGVRGLASSAAGLAAVVETDWGRFAAYTSKDGRKWTRSATLGTIPGTLRDITITDQGLLVAGGDEQVGEDNRPVLMTAERGRKAEPVALDEIPGLSRTARETSRVMAAGDLFVAIGAVSGDAGIWTSADGATWQTVDQRILGGPGRQRLNDLAHGPRGWLAVGSTMTDPARTRPLVVTSTDGRDWRPIAASGPLSADDGRYYLAPHAVAAGPGGYVFAGEDRGGDGAVPALWVTSDLKRFTRAERLPAGGRGVRIHDVAAVPGGYVAVGGSGTAEQESGVIWFSRDGKAWSSRGRIVLEGVGASGLRRVVALDSRLVAVGTALTEQGPRPFAAVSTDTATTWETAWLPSDDAAAVLDLTATSSGLLAVGTHGPPGTGDSTVWVSEDGLEWQRHMVTADGLAGEGAQSLGTVAVLGRQVVAIGRSTTYTTDHLTLWRATIGD